MQLTEYIGYGTVSLGIFQVVSFLMGDAAPTGKFAGVSRFSISAGLPVWLAWWTMEQPSVLVPMVALGTYFAGGGALHPGVIYLCAMFIVHYIQRSFIYPFCNNVGRDYPLHAWCFAMLFTTLNGTMQSNDLLYGTAATRSWADGLCHPRVLFGFCVWAFGMFCNVQADTILRNLRPPGSAALKNKTYVIPRGGLFEYVSGCVARCLNRALESACVPFSCSHALVHLDSARAHFVGEIIEWSGYAIACQSFAPTCFALFNMMGIGTRAIATHNWNLEKFGDKYPVNRKKLIPFVW